MQFKMLKGGCGKSSTRKHQADKTQTHTNAQHQHTHTQKHKRARADYKQTSMSGREKIK